MNNIPKMKIGIVAVSRDCFPESLSVNRRKALVDAYAAKYDAADIYECPVCIVESEIHMVQALEDVKEARAQGDLSENFEYYAAKKYKNQNESRIRYLENMLKNAIVISDESRSDEVGLNKAVTLYMEDDDEEETYKLVTSIRGNSMHNMVSIESPLGKAILRHKVGDRVEITTDNGYSYFAEIRKIEDIGDEDDTIRKF